MHKLTKKEILDLKEDEKINNYLFDKIFELGEKIIKVRNLKYEPLFENNRENELHSMSEHIYYYSVWFDSYRFLAGKAIYDDPVNNINYIVRSYNELLHEYRDYQKQKKRIKEIGYEKLFTEATNNLKEIFCKMLDFKNKKYNKDDSLGDLIDKLILCYVDYKYMFDDVDGMLRNCIYKDTVRDDFWLIRPDHVEVLSCLEFTYHFFADDENSYKNYTKYSEDIILKEGQTLKDLYYEEQEKMKQLYIEMLEFLNIKIDDKNDSTHIEYLIHQNYPFFYQSMIRGVHEYSYVNLIGILRSNYEYFKENYKNHDELLEIYKKYYDSYDEESDEEIELYTDEDFK